MQLASTVYLRSFIACRHRAPGPLFVRPMHAAHPMARRQTRLEPSCLKAATVRPAFVHLFEGVISILLLIIPNDAPCLPLCVVGRLTTNRRLCTFARRIALCLALGALRLRHGPCLCSTVPAEPMPQQPPFFAANCSPRAAILPALGADRAVLRPWSRTWPHASCRMIFTCRCRRGLPPHAYCRINFTCRCRHGLPPHVCYRIGSCRCRCRPGWIPFALARALRPTYQSWL